MKHERTALVIGAKGGIGGEVTAALRARGWAVRALVRNAVADRAGDDQIEWIAGDAMRSEDVLAAARGATLIVHAANPAGYRDWDKLAVPMLDNTIAAAKAVGARILFPGTIYNFGPDAFPVLGEDSPQHPVTRKGAIRVAMEQRLRQAASAGTPVLIVRAGDFFGPRVGNNWFSQALVKPGRPVRAIVNPGAPGTGHAWAYLPDLAETMVRLVERGDALDRFAVFHFGGHWDHDGAQMTAAIRRVVGDDSLPERRFPWFLVRLASPFVVFLRELHEVRHLWRQPLRLDNTRLAAVLGGEPHTPLDVAVRRTLEGLGCLGGNRSRERPATRGAALAR